MRAQVQLRPLKCTYITYVPGLFNRFTNSGSGRQVR